MAEQRVVGVDFSGAGLDDSVGGTWVTEGYFDGHILTIEDCRPVSRVGLEIFLKKLQCGSVAALDFPFSIPISFAKFWQSNYSEMPDLWAAAAAIDLDQFRTVVTQFEGEYDFEHLRVGDLLFPQCPAMLAQGLSFHDPDDISRDADAAQALDNRPFPSSSSYRSTTIVAGITGSDAGCSTQELWIAIHAVQEWGHKSPTAGKTGEPQGNSERTK